MNIDERLEKLTERHEALAQSVELLTINVDKLQQTVRENIAAQKARDVHIDEYIEAQKVRDARIDEYIEAQRARDVRIDILHAALLFAGADHTKRLAELEKKVGQ